MNAAITAVNILQRFATGEVDPGPYPDIIGVNTTAAGLQVFLVLGDSIPNGSNNSTGPGPTPTPGTVKQWNGSAVIDIGSSDVYNVPLNGGTFMPQMGISYNAATGRIAVFIPLGSSGAEYSPNGDNNNWSASGTLRANAITQVTNCLAFLGLTQLKGILEDGGINDARAATTLATVLSDVDSFFNWVTTTWPGVPVQSAQIGRTESVTNNVRIYSIRERKVANAISKTDVHMCFNLASWINSGGYGADLLHPNQTGNNYYGNSNARWWSNLSYSKWTRSALASNYGDLTTVLKNKLATLLSTIGDDLFQFEYLHILAPSNAFDIANDLAFLQTLHLNTCSVVLDSYMQGNGVDQSFEITYNQSFCNLRSSQNDFLVGVYLIDNEAVGTRSLFGGSNASIFTRFTGGNLQYVANDGTTRTVPGPIATFSDNKCYDVYRSSTTKGVLEDGVVLDSIVQASTGALNRNMRYLAFNSGSLSQFFQGKVGVAYAFKYSGVNIPRFVAAIKAYFNA